MPKRLPYDIEELRRLYFDEGLDCDAVAERVGMGTGKTVGDHLLLTAMGASGATASA